MFWIDNEKWLKHCQDQLKEMGYTEEEVNNCDICDNGQVYFGNLSMTEKGFVTPFEDWKLNK